MSFAEAVLSDAVIKTEMNKLTPNKSFMDSCKDASVNIGVIVIQYLMSSMTPDEIQAMLLTSNIADNQDLQDYLLIAQKTQNGLIQGGFDRPKANFRKIVQKRSKQKLADIEINLDIFGFEVIRAVYLEYFEKEVNEAQRIYRYLVNYYVSIYENNLEEADKKFGNCLSNLEKIGDYWTYDHRFSSVGGMDVAIASLSNHDITSESHLLLCKLAKLGHPIAIFRLNTKDDKKSQHIIINLLEKNEYALGKLKQALNENEAWVEENFAWNQKTDDQMELVKKSETSYPISFMQAVEAGNMLAFEKFEKQQTSKEALERLDIVKRILALDLDITLPDEEGEPWHEDGIKSIPYQANYNFTPILPNLERQVFDKVNQAVAKYTYWKHARCLLAECYKLAIGTEQCIIKSLNQFVRVRDIDYMNIKPINRADGSYLIKANELIEPLVALTKGFHIDNTLPELAITKDFIQKNTINSKKSITLYPEADEVFVSEQAWLGKHFMPIIKINLGLLKDEWQGIDLPICLAYEPDGGECNHIGEKTETYHNNHLNEGWFSFKLTNNNKYEFLGDEHYFYVTDNEAVEALVNIRKDIQKRKKLSQQIGDLYQNRYRDGKHALEPVGKNANGEDIPYFKLGGENPREFIYIPPSFYCIHDNNIVTMDDKSMYHIMTISGTYFAEYPGIGDISVFFEPDSRTVLYSCKYTRQC